MPKEYLYWCLLHITLKKLIEKIKDEKSVGASVTKKKGGGEWDITACEKWDQPIQYSSSSHNTGNNDGFFTHYMIEVADLYTKYSDYGMSQHELTLLADIVKNDRSQSALNPSESKIVDELARNHVVYISGDEIKINFPAFNEIEKKEFSAYHDIVNEIYEGEVYRLFETVCKDIYNAMCSSLPARFKDDGSIKKAASDLLYLFACMLPRYAYKNGIITIPEGEDKSAVTMYMGY